MEVRFASPNLAGAARGQAAVLAAALGAVTLWGATPLVTKVAVVEIDPLAVGMLRSVLGAAAAVILGGVALARSRPA